MRKIKGLVVGLALTVMCTFPVLAGDEYDKAVAVLTSNVVEFNKGMSLNIIDDRNYSVNFKETSWALQGRTYVNNLGYKLFPTNYMDPIVQAQHFIVNLDRRYYVLNPCWQIQVDLVNGRITYLDGTHALLSLESAIYENGYCYGLNCLLDAGIQNWNLIEASTNNKYTWKYADFGRHIRQKYFKSLGIVKSS